MTHRESEPEVMVVGIDGASWIVLNAMMRTGVMPNLKRLVESGVSGDLTSTIPPISAPAWTSFMTGKNPGKHGVFSWTEALNRRFVPVNARAIDGKTLWQLLSEAGKRVGVFNVPMTYPLPSYPIDGFMITGSLTPSVESEFTYPASLRDELRSLVGDYTIYVPWQEYEHRRDRERALVKDLAAQLEQRGKVALALLDKRETDFFMLVLAGNDRMSHCLWQYMVPDPAAKLDEEGQTIQQMIQAYYGQLDALLGQLVERCAPSTSIFVVSDHGFGPIRKEICINKWLADEGFLVSNSRPAARRMRNGLRNLARSVGVTKDRWRRLLGDEATQAAEGLVNTVRIDWSRTRAYSNGSSNTVQVNLRGREPYGIVEPGSEYERTRQAVIERLAELRDPDTGGRVVRDVFRREDIYEGPHVERAPDVLLVMADEGYVAYRPDVDVDSVFHSPGWRTGRHTLEGVLVATGKDVKRGADISGARIIDMAPTILHVMGLPVPDDMDGRILTGLFNEAFLRSSPPATAKASDVVGSGVDHHEQTDDEEAILDRLRGLGYIE